MNNEYGTLDFELVKRCLSEFLENHERDASLRQLSISAASLEGIRKKERKDLWLFGEWVFQGSPILFEASWSYYHRDNESSRLIVKIERKEKDYIVVDWSVEETF